MKMCIYLTINQHAMYLFHLIFVHNYTQRGKLYCNIIPGFRKCFLARN